jgi:phenylalanyl-tRNA synthetase beta chain
MDRFKSIDEQCSHDENFSWLNHKDDGSIVVTIANPKSIETQTCRISLIPGLLKSLRENRDRPLPNRIFEVGDVVLKGEEDKSLFKQRDWVGKGTGARNVRMAAAAFRGVAGGFETVQGIMERVLGGLEIPRLSKEDREKEDKSGFWIEEEQGESKGRWNNISEK